MEDTPSSTPRSAPSRAFRAPVAGYRHAAGGRAPPFRSAANQAWGKKPVVTAFVTRV
ncbi:hypothetical protein ACOJBO_38005 [Rhizobium beringeri]